MSKGPKETSTRAMHCPIEYGDSEVLLDFAAARLSAPEAARFEAHLAVCPECARVTAAQQSVWSAMDAWEAVPLSPDFNRRLYDRIEQEEGSRGFFAKWAGMISTRLSFLNWRPLVPVAAAGLTLAIALMIQRPEQHAATPSTRDAYSKVEKIDVDQVERALDDLDMLNKLSETGSNSAI